MGNPRFYWTFADEGANRELAQVARSSPGAEGLLPQAEHVISLLAGSFMDPSPASRQPVLARVSHVVVSVGIIIGTDICITALETAMARAVLNFPAR